MPEILYLCLSSFLSSKMLEGYRITNASCTHVVQILSQSIAILSPEREEIKNLIMLYDMAIKTPLEGTLV